MLREEQFREYLASSGLAAKTADTRCWALKRVESAEGVTLDSEYERDGLMGLLKMLTYSASDLRSLRPNPISIDIEPDNLPKFLSFYKSAVNSYRIFLSQSQEDTPSNTTGFEIEPMDALAEAADRTFSLERDMQAALRSDISQLESGLKIVDDGKEARVEAGFIDILAKDSNDVWTIVELKSEAARPAVIAQTLAYMASVAAEKGGNVRGIIVAAEFDKRIRLAAQAVSNLVLKKYRFRFEFDEPY